MHAVCENCKYVSLPDTLKMICTVTNLIFSSICVLQACFSFLLLHSRVTMWINIASNNQNFIYVYIVVFVCSYCLTAPLGCLL